MDPTLTLQDTPMISRNPGGTKTDDGNLTDLTFPTSQSTPIFKLNSSKDDDRNLTVLTVPSFQDTSVSRDSNNDNNNDNQNWVWNIKDISYGRIIPAKATSKKVKYRGRYSGKRDMMIFFETIYNQK